jgi:hypothetical protein
LGRDGRVMTVVVLENCFETVEWATLAEGRDSTWCREVLLCIEWVDRLRLEWPEEADGSRVQIRENERSKRAIDRSRDERERRERIIDVCDESFERVGRTKWAEPTELA